MTLLNQLHSRALPRRRSQNGRSANGGGQQSQQQQNKSSHQHVNVGASERAISVASGAVLALLGLSRRTLPGILTAGIGGAMIYRGLSGHCHAYEAMGLNTAEGEDGQSREKMIHEKGIHIAQAFLINRPASELYQFWRNFENLPRIMSHLESVRVIDDRRSHWIANAHIMGGRHLEWDAEITRDEPDNVIAWRSLPGADVQNAGEIRFTTALGDRGTEVHVWMDYVPHAGKLGHWIASLVGGNPKRLVREDLRNFKRLMEMGEVLTIAGQPHGTCAGRGKRDTDSGWKPLFT